MEYCQTRDILYVKEILGHKAIINTLKYIHLAEMLYDHHENYMCRRARNMEEATELIESGFECVTRNGRGKAV